MVDWVDWVDLCLGVVRGGGGGSATTQRHSREGLGVVPLLLLACLLRCMRSPCVMKRPSSLKPFRPFRTVLIKRFVTRHDGTQPTG